MKSNISEIIEGQRSRETRLAGIVFKYCPDLVLHSRVGRGQARTFVPRLRFDRSRRFGWFFRLFTGRISSPALAITGNIRSALDMSREWIPIEIHCYDMGFLNSVLCVVVAYRNETGCPARVIEEPLADDSRWKPAIRVLLAIAAMSAILIGVRLLSMSFFKNLFSF